MDDMDAPHEKRLDGYTIIFDLDGTLIDTAPDLVAALNFSLRVSGYQEVPAGTVKGQIGLGSMAMIETGLASQGLKLEQDQMNNIRKVFLEHYANNTAKQSTPYSGVIDALDRVENAGAVIAICTNKPQALADTLMTELGLHIRFRAIVGSDSVPARKPHPDHLLRTIHLAGGQPQRAIMLGDSTPDEEAARRAELPFIFIPFGYGPIGPAHSSRIELDDYANLTPEFVLSLF